MINEASDVLLRSSCERILIPQEHYRPISQCAKLVYNGRFERLTVISIKKKKFFKASVTRYVLTCHHLFCIWIIYFSFWSICHYTAAACFQVTRTCEIHLYSSTTFINPIRNYLPFTSLPQAFIHSKGHTVLVTYRTSGC